MEEPHGVATATYVSDGEKYRPFIECLCGWQGGRCGSWAEAGFELDQHIEEALEKEKRGKASDAT